MNSTACLEKNQSFTNETGSGYEDIFNTFEIIKPAINYSSTIFNFILISILFSMKRKFRIYDFILFKAINLMIRSIFEAINPRI